MPTIDIRTDLSGFHKSLISLQAKQVPFATALALTRLAKGAAEAESAAIAATFDTPTPFTQRAVRTESATKSRPVALVEIKDVQAGYLAPYVRGGLRALGGKRGMIVPRDVGVNKYGNLARGKLAALKARPDTFIGTVKFKNGNHVSGVWQRSATARGARRKGNGEYGTRGKHHRVAGNRTTLKLLIQFKDTTTAPKQLPFEATVRSSVQRNANAAFRDALKQAVASARS